MCFSHSKFSFLREDKEMPSHSISRQCWLLSRRKSWVWHHCLQMPWWTPFPRWQKTATNLLQRWILEWNCHTTMLWSAIPCVNFTTIWIAGTKLHTSGLSEVNCPPVKDYNHSSPDTYVATAGSTVNYHCHDGFDYNTTMYTMSMSCLYNASWDHQPGDCTGKYRFGQMPLNFTRRSTTELTKHSVRNGGVSAKYERARWSIEYCRGILQWISQCTH